jgi:hypothetical protein
MSDVFCNACGKYHASLTACPNENIMDTKNTPPLCKNCVAVTSLEAEITRFKARDAEMRAAIVGSLVTLRSSMGNTNKVMYTEANLSRALIARESAIKEVHE